MSHSADTPKSDSAISDAADNSSTIVVSAVQLWSSLTHTPDQNREHALDMARRAAKPPADAPQPDLVVLPESVAMLCYPDGRPGFTYRDVADPIPGKLSSAFAAIAREARVNLVVGLIEDRGPEQPCQNTAVVFDRAGELVGRYDKIHEPEVCRREQAAGVGDDIPVFSLNFGRIGIMICWDLISPEIAQILMLKGADLICFPHMIGLPTVASFATTLRARAIDTGLPIVASGMRDAHNHNGCQDGLCPTCILDATGGVVGQSQKPDADVITATLTLRGESPNRRRVAESVNDRRPDVYAMEYGRMQGPESAK